MGDESRKISELVRNWDELSRSVTEAERKLSRVQIDFRNSISELGKAIIPKDAALNESFGIWINAKNLSENRAADGDVLLMCQRTTSGYEIKIRK